MLILFLNDVDILFILEFKNSFGKKYSVFPKNPKHFYLPGAFSDKQFCKNLRACNFFAIWLRRLILFKKDEDNDIQLILEFKKSFGKKIPVFPKILKRTFFLGHPAFYNVSIIIPYVSNTSRYFLQGMSCALFFLPRYSPYFNNYLCALPPENSFFFYLSLVWRHSSKEVNGHCKVFTLSIFQNFEFFYVYLTKKHRNYNYFVKMLFYLRGNKMDFFLFVKILLFLKL